MAVSVVYCNVEIYKQRPIFFKYYIEPYNLLYECFYTILFLILSRASLIKLGSVLQIGNFIDKEAAESVFSSSSIVLPPSSDLTKSIIPNVAVIIAMRTKVLLKIQIIFRLSCSTNII